MESKGQVTIAFLGIGLMGEPMAKRLVAAGYPLIAWNRTSEKAARLLPYGAKVAATIGDAVAQADIVITMLESGQIVLDVLRTAKPCINPGTLVIDMSSTKQSEALDLHLLLTQSQIAFLDAPVSGGVLGAESGSLAIMAGGSESDYARALPVLTTLGRPTLVGPAGSGQVAKLCNQLIVGGTLSLVSEALLFAHAAGADPAAVRNAIRGGFAESRVLEVHGQRMLERSFLPGGQVKSQVKDIENILHAADAAGITLPVTQKVKELFESILDDFSAADQSAALLALERINPGKRLGTGPDKLP